MPFVANSPIMSFFYRYPAPEYREPYPAGGLNLSQARVERDKSEVYSVLSIGLHDRWHRGAYCSAPVAWRPQVAAVGSFLLILMSVTTLSFLVTTPEAWVSGSGSTVHGFPFLAFPGLLVVKDCIMLGAAVLTMADSARVYLSREEVLTMQRTAGQYGAKQPTVSEQKARNLERR